MKTRMTAEQFRQMFASKYPAQLSAMDIHPKGEATKSVTIQGEYRIPTTNNAYWTNPKTFKRHLTKQGRACHEFIAKLCAGRRIVIAEWYRLDAIFTLPLYTQEGEVRDWDCTNHIKLVEDAMCKALGVKDKRNRPVTLDKIEGPYGFILTLTALDEGRKQLFKE